MTGTPAVYLAGPEVFMPNARTLAAKKKEICAQHGLAGLFPLDADVEAATRAETAQAIFMANIELIRRANGLIANLTPFRGVSADVGTAFEVGVAHALGKPCFAYSLSVEPFEARTAAAYAPTTQDADGLMWAADGLMVEAFGLADNLMLPGALKAQGRQVVIQRDTGDTTLAAFETCVRQARLCSVRSDPSQSRRCRARLRARIARGPGPGKRKKDARKTREKTLEPHTARTARRVP